MRKSALPVLSLTLICLLGLAGCKPSANSSAPGAASASTAPPSGAAATAAASTTAATASTPPQAAAPTPSGNVQRTGGSPMNPGLWEITMQSDQMKQQPQISPQQAAQMKKMGITVPEQRDGGMVVKVCYTKEMLAEKEVPSAHNNNECQPANMSRNGNEFSGQVVCNGPNMKGTGTTQGTMSATGFRMSNNFSGTMGGQPVNHKTQISGTYLGPDCGNVKPVGVR